MKVLVPTTLLGLLILSAPATGTAGQFEFSAWAGPSIPFYSQTFSYQPPPIPPLPGFSVDQVGEFRFGASGGVSFGAAFAWQFADRLDVELRVDSGAIDLGQEGGSFQVIVRPPSPLPPVPLDVETDGRITLGRLVPVSLNLRYRAGGGRVGLVASGGLSYLPSLDFAISQDLGLGAIGGISGIQLPTLPLEAGGQIDAFWGMNAGLGLRFRLSDALSANVEGRAFFFGEQELAWKIDRFPVRPEFGEILRQQLDPIRFTPGFFQATAGLSVRF